MIYNLSLIPIGNSYWVTATKIGSNYIKNFANPNELYLRLSISNVVDEHTISDEYIYVTFPNGLKLKFQIFDFNNVDFTHKYDSNSILDIFKKVTIVLTRNPMERFKSGFVQKISELYSEILPAIKSDNLNNVRFHENVYYDLTKYDVNYSLLIDGFGITPKQQNPNWLSEWNKFTKLVTIDTFNRCDIHKILLDDRHTQPVYHFFYLILNSLPNWQNIKTLDINELDSNSELIIDELGIDEYQRRLDILNNRQVWNEDIEYINVLKRISNKRLYFHSNLISEYFERSPIYIYEKMYYDILNNKQYKRTIDEII